MSQRTFRSQLVQQFPGTIEHLGSDRTIFEQLAKTTFNFRFRKQESLHTEQGKEQKVTWLIL